MTTDDNKPAEMTEFGALIATADGSYTVRHAGHGQDFHSSEGARFEAWELYVRASGIEPALATPGKDIRVLDIGMGLGYNASATLAAWLQSPGHRSLSMLSVEIDARLVEVFAGGDAPWCKGWPASWLNGCVTLIRREPDVWRSVLNHPRGGGQAIWEIRVCDGSKLDMDALNSEFDFFWQDPFTPELNPDMWGSAWFRKLRLVAAENATLMTYSVSRSVKTALEQSGWSHERFRTPGKKRHWLRASPRL